MRFLALITVNIELRFSKLITETKQAYFLFSYFLATVQLPAEKFLTPEESSSVMPLEKKELQIILNSSDEIFAEIRFQNAHNKKFV